MLKSRIMSTGDKDLIGLLLDDSSCGGGLDSQSLGTFDVPEAFGATPDGTVATGAFNTDPAAAGGATQRPPSPAAAGSGSGAGRVLGSHYPLSLVAAGYGAAEASGEELEDQEPSLAEGSGGMGGGEGAGSVGNVIPRNLPPRAAADAGDDSDDHSSSSRGFSDDDTEKDVVHTSDGNMSVSDDWCSVIGSNDGEGSGASESSYLPPNSSSDEMYDSSYSELSESTSTRSDDGSTGSTGSNGSIVSCDEGDGDEFPCMDRPIGMMLATANLGDSQGDFVCSKVRQKYEKAGADVFEVVFKDGSRTEYSREEVVLYRDTYVNNKGERGCFEFFFKV